MLKSLRLLAPVLIPSWRFVDTITASPRIEVARLGAADQPVENWREFRPRPARLTLPAILLRLVWNPRWNETLFLTSCAERLLQESTGHSVREISRRIAAELRSEGGESCAFKFRLVLVSREGAALERQVAYVSPRQAVSDDDL